MRQILRQIVAVLALVGLSMNLVPSALAATSYTDVSAANKLANAGIIVNNSANTAGYHLNDNVLRQEAVKVVAGALGGILENEANYSCTGAFSDVARGTWVCRIAELAKNAGLVAANPTFRPTAKLSRLEAIIFALRSAELMPAGDHSTSEILGYAVDAGLITSAAGVSANAAATRGEFFRYVAKALDAAELPDICTLAPDLCGNNGGNNGGNTSGSVSASLTAGQPTGLIVAGQATADLARFTFSGNGTLNNVVLTRTGISDQNTLSNVYLYDGNTRLTDGYSFNSVGVITINNLNLAVNGSRTLTVKADVAAGAASGQTIVVSLTKYTANGSSAATVNLSGNTLTTGAAGSLATASLGANTVIGTPTVNAGISSYVFWSAPLQVNTRTVSLQAANFRLVGSAPADALSNIQLYVDGVNTGKLASIVSTNGSNYASFDLGSAPLSLTTGLHTLDVRANVEKGSARTVQLSVQQASDLMIRDPQVGINIAVTGTIPNSAVSVSINAGSITIDRDPVFNAMTNVTGGGSNTTIAKFKLHAYGEDVKVQSIQVLPTIAGTTPAAAGLDSVTLYYNGSQVGTQQNWTAGNLTFQLGSQLIAAAGTDSYLEVRANIRTTTGINYTAGTVQADIVVGSANAQGQSSLNSISTPARTGNSLTIQTGLLSVSKNSAYANTSANPNTQDVKIGSYTLQNQSTSESVRVTNLAVALTLGVGTSINNFSSLKTSETSGSGANPIQPTLSNTFSVDFSLAPGATKTIDIFATSGTDTGGTVTIIPTLTVTSIGATSNVSTTSAGIVGQTVAFSNATITTPTTAVNFIANASSNAQFVAAGNSGTGLVDGTKNVFKLVSSGGAATVSELKFTVTGTDTISSIRVGNASAPVVSGVAYLTGVNIVVPDGGSGYSMEVYPTYSKVGTNGLTSGSTSVVNLAYIKYTSGGSTSTICTAAIGTCTATIAVGGVVANTMTLVASKPTVTVAKPTSTVAVGNIRAIEVTVAADAKGDITLNSFPITVGANGATVSTSANTIVVTKADNSPVTTTNTAFGAASGGSSTITLTGGYLIPAGTSQTFLVYVPVATVTGTGVNGASLSTSLATGAGFSWTDTAGAAGAAQTGSTNVYGYPNTFTSVVYN